MSRRDRLRTLYLDSNGAGPWMVRIDTILRGILGFKDGDPPPGFLKRFRKMRWYFGWLRDQYAVLSYIADWRDAFRDSPRLNVDVCNVNNLVEYAGYLRRIREYDLIVVSHAAAGDDMMVMARSAGWLNRRRGRLVMFIGNEYALMDEKIAFMGNVRADLVCSQLPLDAARYLYEDSGAVALASVPHALNPRHYHVIPQAQREVDIGFIGDIYWPFIGDRERTDFIEWFEANATARGLVCDIRRKRVGREEWNRFLNGCKGIIGAESGSYYLNDRARLLDRARLYNIDHPDSTFDAIFERFYRNQPRQVSGKAISSRHFEPVGTGTCQILLEGAYNGLLTAGTHYIGVKSDYSDIDEAIRQFKDESVRAQIIQQAHDHVMNHHTYARRVETVLGLIGAGAP